ncbi:hypothetical protein [Roseateles sp.]|jgi:hypothetical protein|uniref:hypothetical protein n=1 Tax=Roseateles sp. TaxID=1971397 RepID=UPI003D13AC81
MTEPKDGESFFRKVARFVANPTTDWAEINSRQDDPEGDQAKAELRAMVERKRRNDFVRKRELDMLRRIRREGLTPEQLAALGSSNSKLEEVERASASGNSEVNSKIDLGVKAKIDEIEQQMAGESFAPTQVQSTHPPGFFETSTRPVHFSPTTITAEPGASRISRVSEFASAAEKERMDSKAGPAALVMGAGMAPLSDAKPSRLPSLGALPAAPFPPAKSTSAKAARQAAPAAAERAKPAPAPAPAARPPATALPVLDQALSFLAAEKAPVEVHELIHDPELDEAVIAFANADYESCERALVELTRSGGRRHGDGETWLVLFDHYRATGQQAKFEALALTYAQQFGRSAPQWFSLPKLVAEAAAKQVRAPMAKSSNISWAAPEALTEEAVALLQKRCQNMPMPWVLDWSAARQVDPVACVQLRDLFRSWAGQQVDMRWLAGEAFLQALKELTPIGVREVDPQLWMLRLEALRLVNRPDQFDEAAIDYCVTYEVSPPSWERTRCRVSVSGTSLSTTGPTTSTATQEGISTSFMESQITEQAGLEASVQLELSGQLSGDISELLRKLSGELGAATVINVSCPRLIRLDFMAAGDLLNWVLSRRSENRSVSFSEPHRLVAMFFAAMGINEHAKIKVRTV